MIKQNRYKKAKPPYLKALEMRKKPLKEEHSDIATSLNNLANLYNNQERYKEAGLLYLEALEISKKTLGNNHPNTIAIKEDYKVLMNSQN